MKPYIYHVNIIMTIHAHILSQKGCSLTLCNRPMPACNHVQLDIPAVKEACLVQYIIHAGYTAGLS